MSESACIFLAEDSPADVYLFQEALRVNEVEGSLLVYNDGEAVMSFLLAAQGGPVPDIFVLDLNLPRLDGLEVLKHIRGDSRFARARVIVFSSSQNPAEREECLKLGADRYIQKGAHLAERPLLIRSHQMRCHRHSRQPLSL